MRLAIFTAIAFAASTIAAPAALEVRGDDLIGLIGALDQFGDHANDIQRREELSEPDAETLDALAKFEAAFGDFDDVPDEIANDDVKAAEYFYQHYAGASQSVAERSVLVARADVWQCVKELATSIPIAKIFKLGKLIKKAGGVTELAKKLFKCRTRAICQKVAGDIVVEVFDMITNIPSIKKACIP